MLLFVSLVVFVSFVGAQHEVEAEGGGLNDNTQSFHWVGHDKIRAYMATHNVDRMGYDGSTDLFICKSLYKGHIYPGKFYVDGKGRNVCQFAADGKEHVASVYQVLDTRNEVFTWIIASVNNLPRCAFNVGTDAGTNQPNYVCRVRHEGNLILGRAVKKDGNCYVPYFSKELRFTNYEVAVEKSCAEIADSDEDSDEEDDDGDGGGGGGGSLVLKIVLPIVGIILLAGGCCCCFCVRDSCNDNIFQCMC